MPGLAAKPLTAGKQCRSMHFCDVRRLRCVAFRWPPNRGEEIGGAGAGLWVPPVLCPAVFGLFRSGLVFALRLFGLVFVVRVCVCVCVWSFSLPFISCSDRVQPARHPARSPCPPARWRRGGAVGCHRRRRTIGAPRRTSSARGGQMRRRGKRE